MKRCVPILLVLFLTACAGKGAPRDPGGQADSQSMTGQFKDIATTPLSDLNLVRAKIPPALLEARKQPYALPVDLGCAGLAADVRALDALLGADLDAPTAHDDAGMLERGADFVGDAAVGAARGAAEDIVPFRSWVRKLTGAERHSREVAAAIAAGTLRRAFLKGLGQASGCRPPAAARRDARIAAWTDSPRVADLFRQAGVGGTFVLYDVAAQAYTGHDRARAEKRFVPASTFKIANSLIGLSVGAVGGVDDPLPYRGPAQPFIQAWARDMGLREAMALSNVPIYQELARRIGLERMSENLARLDYGNGEIGAAVDHFWLDGPLGISALEQARLMADLAQSRLPFPAAAQQSVRDILLLEQGDGWRLYGKTGWQNAPGAGIGWWVGWVEKGGRVYAFALNMDIQTAGDAAKRVELGRASLKALGLP